MRLRHYLVAGFVAAGAALASDPSTPVPLPEGGLPISAPGFSIRTPGDGWQVENPGYPIAAFEQGAEGIRFTWTKGEHSAAASVDLVNWDGFRRQGKVSGEDLIAFVSWRPQVERFGQRIRNPHFSIVNMTGNACVRWSADVESSLLSGAFKWHRLENGLLCSHPELPAYAVEMTISQYDKDDETTRAAAAAQESLFNSLNFKALPYAVKEVTIGGQPWAFASAAGSLWHLYVKNGGGDCIDEIMVARIDLATNAVLARIPFETGSCSIAADTQGVWVLNHEKGLLHRIDPATNAVVQSIKVPRYAQELTAGGGYLWLKTYDPGRLLRVDPATSEVHAIDGLGKQPGVIASAGNSVFVSDEQEEVVFQVDAASGKIIQRLKAPRYPFHMKFLGGYLWVVPLDRPPGLLRINPAKADEAPIPVRMTPYGPLSLTSWRNKLAVLGSHASVGLIDPETFSLELLPLPPGDANDIIESGGSLWVAGPTSLYRLDPK